MSRDSRFNRSDWEAPDYDPSADPFAGWLSSSTSSEPDREVKYLAAAAAGLSLEEDDPLPAVAAAASEALSVALPAPIARRWLFYSVPPCTTWSTGS